MDGSKALKTTIVLAALVFAAANLVLAAAPYDSYLFNFWGERVPAPQAYIPLKLVDGQSLGVGPLRRPQDLAIGPDLRVYIADSGNNRVIRL
ncbi:MAG: gluconolactonase, partial [Limnochordia bacterium]